MVYQGPSRGCNSCRHRRKKCDETRPSCLRCTNAGRTCGGYEDTAASAYQRTEVRRADSWPAVSIARKCSLPPRVPIPGTGLFQDDVIPSETSEAESNSLSLRAFLYDFCVVSTNKHLSKGYLSGLELMVRRSGPDSDLVKACQAVSFALHGKPLNRPKMVHKAATFYQHLLGSLVRAIQSPEVANTAESRIVVMLLGLYQMVMASEEDRGCHRTHAKGLAALMKIGNSHLDLLGKTSGVFSVPACQEGQSLDDLLLSLDRLGTKSQAASSPKDIKAVRDECLSLDRRFTSWQHTRGPGFNPTEVGHIGETDTDSLPGVGYWPGGVDTYFDLYVSGVWNIFRAARLLLLALTVKLSNALGEDYLQHVQAAARVVDDMIASVPYHLTDNLPAFVRQLGLSTEIREPGRFLGGLLLLHPLYVASQMLFLPEKTREYLRACLLWIGSRMGIGQATVLANAAVVDSDYLASGCMIVWSGFLW